MDSQVWRVEMWSVKSGEWSVESSVKSEEW